jgi:hypothetical protein
MEGLEAGFEAARTGIVGLNQGKGRATSQGGGDSQARPGSEKGPGPDPFGSQLREHAACLLRKLFRRG